MRVKSFLVSFLVSFLFVSQIPAETVTLKNYPATQTDSEGRTENKEFSILYNTDENDLSFWFVEDFGAWSTRYWFYVGRYGRKKIGKILAKAEEWAAAAKSENLTIEKEFPFNEFTGDISRNELKVTDYGRTDICFYFVAKAGEPYIKMRFKPCGIFKQIKPPAQTMTLEDFRDMSEFLNAPNFKDILKAQKAEAKRKNDILK